MRSKRVAVKGVAFMNIWNIVVSILVGFSLLGILSWIFGWGLGEAILEFLIALIDAIVSWTDVFGDTIDTFGDTSDTSDTSDTNIGD